MKHKIVVLAVISSMGFVGCGTSSSFGTDAIGTDAVSPAPVESAAEPASVAPTEPQSPDRAESQMAYSEFVDAPFPGSVFLPNDGLYVAKGSGDEWVQAYFGRKGWTEETAGKQTGLILLAGSPKWSGPSSIEITECNDLLGVDFKMTKLPTEVAVHCGKDPAIRWSVDLYSGKVRALSAVDESAVAG